LFRKLSIGVCSYGTLEFLYTTWYNYQRPLWILDKMENPEPFSMDDFFPRPDIEKQIKALMTKHDGQYDVIIGPRGTGKTTMVRKISSETPGAVYVYVHDAGDKTVLKLKKELGNAIRWWPKKTSSFEALAGILGVKFGG
jgi:Cdc6-like AAA superfamily ATPase